MPPFSTSPNRADRGCATSHRGMRSSTVAARTSRAATVIDLIPLWLVALPLSALFGLVLKWGIFWVYVGVIMESTSKFFLGVPRFRSRVWINDVTQFSHIKQ